MPDRPPRNSPWFALLLLSIGSLGVAAAWILLAFARDQQSSWMAVVAAIDAAVLLRLARMPAGWRRAGWGVAATAIAIVVANWGIAAAQIGRLVGLANPTPQLAWLLAALVVAVVASR